MVVLGDLAQANKFNNIRPLREGFNDCRRVLGGRFEMMRLFIKNLGQRVA